MGDVISRGEKQKQLPINPTTLAESHIKTSENSRKFCECIILRCILRILDIF